MVLIGDFIVRNIVDGSQAPLRCFDLENVAARESEGFFCYKAQEDGSLAYVPWDEVELPDRQEIRVPFVRGELFVEIMQEMLDALEPQQQPIATLSAAPRASGLSAIRAKVEEAARMFEDFKNGGEPGWEEYE